MKKHQRHQKPDRLGLLGGTAIRRHPLSEILEDMSPIPVIGAHVTNEQTCNLASRYTAVFNACITYR